MNNILILDTETTGIDPKEGNKVIELAAILYHVPTKTVLQQVSTLLPVEFNDAYPVNKITAESSNEKMNFVCGIDFASSMAMHSDYIVAHNAEFDRQWIDTGLLTAQNGSEKVPLLHSKPWICSCHDFVWPQQTRGAKKLTEIAIALGIPVVSAHRALTDCQLLAECFTRTDDLSNRLEDAAKPRELYIALVNYNNRKMASDAGFIWNSLLPKQWAKRMTEEELKKLSFKTKKISLTTKE